MKRICSIVLLIQTVYFGSYAQTWQKTTEGLKTTINKTAVEIQFYNAATVRIIKSPDGSFFSKKVFQ